MSHGGSRRVWRSVEYKGNGAELPNARLPAGLQGRDHECGNGLDGHSGQLHQALTLVTQLHLSPTCCL